jgi:hypothetical protein
MSAAGSLHQGSSEECSEARSYLSETDLLGESVQQRGLPPKSSPASVPYLKFDASLARDDFELIAEDASRLFAKWWPKNPELIRSVLENKFPTIPIVWDLQGVQGYTRDSTVPLVPGRRYFLSATLLIQPVYTQDLIGSWTLSSWQQTVVETTARYAENPMDDRCVVAYHIRLDSAAKQLLKQRDYIVIDFAFDLAALWAYLMLGYSTLYVWQNYGPLKDQYQLNIQQDTMDDSGKITKSKFAGLTLTPRQTMESKMEEVCEELVQRGMLSRPDFQAVMAHYADEQDAFVKEMAPDNPADQDKVDFSRSANVSDMGPFLRLHIDYMEKLASSPENSVERTVHRDFFYHYLKLLLQDKLEESDGD